MNVAFIGMGTMGAPMALNLLKAGDQNTEQMETTYGGTERMFGSMRLEALEFLATLFGKSLDSHL